MSKNLIDSDSYEFVEGTEKTDHNELDARVTNLETRMNSAEGDISTNEGDIANAKSDITDLDTRMTTAEGKITTAQADIANLKPRMTNAESDISNLKPRMTTAESDIANLKPRMTTAEGKITTLEGLVPVKEIENGMCVEPIAVTPWSYASIAQGAATDYFVTLPTSISLSDYGHVYIEFALFGMRLVNNISDPNSVIKVLVANSSKTCEVCSFKPTADPTVMSFAPDKMNGEIILDGNGRYHLAKRGFEGGEYVTEDIASNSTNINMPSTIERVGVRLSALGVSGVVRVETGGVMMKIWGVKTS